MPTSVSAIATNESTSAGGRNMVHLDASDQQVSGSRPP
jgi:hypothetical protein